MKKISLFIGLLFAVMICSAQEKANDCIVNVGYGHYAATLDQLYFANNGVTIGDVDVLTMELNFHNHTTGWGMGAHLNLGGASWSESLVPPATVTRTVGFHYGIDVSYNVLRLFSPSTDRWIVNIKGSLGSFWCPKISPQLEYGAGVMATYYFIEHLGVFGECQWGNYRTGEGAKGSSVLKVGLSFRF